MKKLLVIFFIAIAFAMVSCKAKEVVDANSADASAAVEVKKADATKTEIKKEVKAEVKKK